MSPFPLMFFFNVSLHLTHFDFLPAAGWLPLLGTHVSTSESENEKNVKQWYQAQTSQKSACVLLTVTDYATSLLKHSQEQSCPSDRVHTAPPRSDSPLPTNLATAHLSKFLPLFPSYTPQSSQRYASVFPIHAPTYSQPLCLSPECLPVPHKMPNLPYCSIPKISYTQDPLTFLQPE